jgi:hypothetical protein
MSQERRPEHDTRQQFADDGRLAQPFHDVGEQARKNEQQRELDQEAENLN